MEVLNMIEIGNMINDIKVVNETRDQNGKRMLVCTCQKCGRTHTMYEQNIKNKLDDLCHATVCSKGLKKLDPKFYDIWTHMKARIYNPNNNEYYKYGGIGLTTDYDAYVDFFDDLHTRYQSVCTAAGNSKVVIDRIDHNLGYVRGNIIWNSVSNMMNSNTYVQQPFFAKSPDGRVYISSSQTEFGNKHGINPKYISSCLRGAQTNAFGWLFWYPTFSFNIFVPDFKAMGVIEEFYYR